MDTISPRKESIDLFLHHSSIKYRVAESAMAIIGICSNSNQTMTYPLNIHDMDPTVDDNFLRPMLEVFDKKWDGSIYEIFDGDPVYCPRGCISQAWSIAEILRAWVEDINYIPPVNEKVFESPEICV